MRNISIFCLAALSAILLFVMSCSGSNPILIDPNEPGVDQLLLIDRLTASYNKVDDETWVGAPSGWTIPESKVLITTESGGEYLFISLQDGSFLFKIDGEESNVKARWTAPTGDEKSRDIEVRDIASGLTSDLGPAGLYPNRMSIQDSTVWVVNSGDDELTSYNIADLQPGAESIPLPGFSNPWEADFYSSNEGIITTLFSGVFQFDTGTGGATAVSTDGFRDFASPNGAVILGDNAWVTNPNPLSYFPTEFGTGWVSRISRVAHPAVNLEVNTKWFNPQYIITDGTNIYVSCSGTIDFVAPDYHAVALDPGGVVVLNADGDILNEYELGLGGPGPMGLSPDGRYLWIGSGVAGWLFRIDLVNHEVLNDASNPIVISDYPGTYVPFIEISDTGLLACASFNADTIYFADSYTGKLNPFPVFEPVQLSNDEPDFFYGPQDAVFTPRNGEFGLLILTTVESGFSWLKIH